MITVWGVPIVATVEQVLKDIKLQLYGAGLLRDMNNTGADLMITCPFHKNGKEHSPSCGVLLKEKVVIDGLKTCEELRDIGVGVFFEDYNICSINEDKDFELALFFSLAQKESQTKSYNVKWGLRQRQKSKLWRGTPPYGYYKDDAGEFQIDLEQAKAINLVVDMYLEGAGIGKIVGALRAGGYPTYGRGEWCATHVRNMLKRELYNGHYYTHTMENKTIKDHNKKDYIPKEEQIYIPLPHCKIIDDDRWERVQAELERRAKLYVENVGYRERNTYLFSNLLYCECGNAYRSKVDNRPAKKGKEPVIYWRCADQDKYGQSSKCINLNKKGFLFKQELIEEAVKQEILRMKADKEHLLQLFMIKEIITTGFPLTEEEIAELQREKAQIESNIKKILFRDDNIYEDMLKELENELRNIKNTISMQEYREEMIKRDKINFDRYIKDLESIDVNNLDNATLKRLFYKIHIIDMSNYNKELKEPQRGVMFDYYFLQMPYSELMEKAVQMQYPRMEELPIDMKVF